jgi:hypothetical protein
VEKGKIPVVFGHVVCGVQEKKGGWARKGGRNRAALSRPQSSLRSPQGHTELAVRYKGEAIAFLEHRSMEACQPPTITAAQPPMRMFCVMCGGEGEVS